MQRRTEPVGSRRGNLAVSFAQSLKVSDWKVRNKLLLLVGLFAAVIVEVSWIGIAALERTGLAAGQMIEAT